MDNNSINKIMMYEDKHDTDILNIDINMSEEDKAVHERTLKLMQINSLSYELNKEIAVDEELTDMIIVVNKKLKDAMSIKLPENFL